jgi:hypothetical protein
MIRLNSIKFYLNLMFWALEAFLYIPLAPLVKFPAISLYIYTYFYYFIFHLVSPSRTNPAPRPIFPNAPTQLHYYLAPAFLHNSF